MIFLISATYFQAIEEGLRQKSSQQAGQPAASPVLVATLTDMGFPRERVEEALRQTNNDVDQATNLLLVGM